MAEKIVPVISLKDFEIRKEDITKELVAAAEHAGFLTLVDHGITIEEIEAQFAISQAYFGLPLETKSKIPHQLTTNNGFEYYSQIRPSTGTADQKESFWLQRNSEWPSDQDVPGFSEQTNKFMRKCESISEKVLSCLSRALGFPENYFGEAMDVNASDNLTQMRMLHYPASEKTEGLWRAGVHTDIGCLTLLFQRDGEDGLEICPGRESHSSYAMGDTFFPLAAKTGPIVVNIGDMLMAWSDDRLKANFHRVRATGKSDKDRYSIAYFNTGRKNFVMQGPLKKYPAITCGDYFLRHTKKQFG
ncbi:iron/ascorbate family oxidoreductase [Xylariales sp. PMI_506]|nr:iron/ascorbate family oxidoreductase [Xylariales sp. PMI_506]